MEQIPRAIKIFSKKSRATLMKISFMFLKMMLIFIATSFVTLPVFAQTGVTGQVQEAPIYGGGFFEGMQQIGQALSRRLVNLTTEAFLSAGLSYAQALTTSALALAGALSLVYLLYEGISYMASRNKSAVEVFFDVGIPATMSALLISNYVTLMREFNGVLELIRNVAGDTSTLLQQVVNLYSHVLALVSKTISQAFDAIGAQVVALDLLGTLTAFADLLLTGLFVLAIVGVVIVGLAEIAGLILMGPFLFAVGVAFGPIFLAGLVSPWTREYVTKWAGFMVGAATLTGVLGVMIGIASSVFSQLNFTEITQGVGEMSSAAQLAIAAILLLAINSVIAQAPMIASALVPGTLGTRLGSGGSIIVLGQGMMQTAKGAFNKTANAFNKQASVNANRLKR